MGQGEGPDIRRPRVDLLALVALDLGCEPDGARCLFSHGSVVLDGRVLAHDETMHEYDDVCGSLLRYGRQEKRLIAGIGPNLQLEAKDGLSQMELS